LCPHFPYQNSYRVSLDRRTRAPDVLTDIALASKLRNN
jgi:hypothetical protein